LTTLSRGEDDSGIGVIEINQIFQCTDMTFIQSFQILLNLNFEVGYYSLDWEDYGVTTDHYFGGGLGGGDLIGTG
jgi:hypothetical protein